MNKNKTVEYQIQFLKQIEAVLPNNTSLVNELADILSVSIDSAYRRMRGETFLSIDEVVELSEKFNISFEGFNSSVQGNVNFKYIPTVNSFESLISYFKQVLGDLKLMKQSGLAHIYYACQDIPVFYHYQYEQMSAFKLFYWAKSILNIPELEDKQFDRNLLPKELLDTANEIVEQYKSITSTEIWSDSTVNSAIQQIKYYHDAGLFKSEKDALAVCADLKQEIEDIQRIAKESSYRSNEGDLIDYSLYYSEVEFTNNCVLAKIGDNRGVYLGHKSFATMSTNSRIYAEETEIWLNNMIKKSTLISGLAEKIRFQFFKRIFKQIDKLEMHIEE